MKNFNVTKLFVVIALFLFAGLSIASAAEKNGYVELGVLFDKYSKTKEADKLLADMAKEKQGERDKLVEDIRRMKDELVLLSENGEEKVKKQAEIDEKIKELQDFDTKTRDELNKVRDEKVKDIFDTLNNAIKDFAEKNKYDFIFSDRALVYKNEKYNVTEDVLTALEEEGK